MTWNVSLIGRPESICSELDKYGEKLDPHSKMEFDAAKPHLEALVRENYIKTSTTQPLIQIDAMGSGTMPTSRNCQVSIKILTAKLV